MSARREGKIEVYLRGQVRALGGDTRKWVSPGHRGVPDQIVLWPGDRDDFVETKFEDGPVKSHQEREHKRLRDLGKRVFVLRTKEAVDQYVDNVREEYLWIFRARSRSTK